MVRKTETKRKRRGVYKAKRKEPSGWINEGLKKELDALVPPIAVEKEDSKERVEAQTEKRPEKAVSEAPIQKERSMEGKPGIEKQAKPAKKKIDPWGIVIGETD